MLYRPLGISYLFVARDLSISVDDLLCSFPLLKAYLLASHAIFLLQAFLLIITFFNYIASSVRCISLYK